MNRGRKLTVQEQKEATAMFREGKKCKEIARHFGVSESQASKHCPLSLRARRIKVR